MNEPQKDLVIEAREWCESSDAMLDEPMRQRLAQLCNEVERLRKQIKTMQRNAREDAPAAANEARWQERQGEDYGSH